MTVLMLFVHFVTIIMQHHCTLLWTDLTSFPTDFNNRCLYVSGMKKCSFTAYIHLMVEKQDLMTLFIYIYMCFFLFTCIWRKVSVCRC